MLYKKIIVNFKKNIEPTDIYVRGNKIELSPRQGQAAQKQPKKIISKENPITKNKQVIETDESNDQFVFSQGFGDYLKHLAKSGRYSPVHLLPEKDKLSFFSKVKNEYEKRSDKYKEEKKAKNSGKNLTVKDDLLAGWDQTKSIAFTAFSSLVKPILKKGGEKVGSTMASMAKSMKMDGPIKGIFKKIGIDIKDIEEEGKIFTEKHSGYMDFNGHFFRCRGSKGVQDFLVFTTIGVGGKVVMAVLGIGAAGGMIANPLTAPLGCILMAMSAKKGFETVVFDSPAKLASIMISLAQGIKDKNTKIKITDENGRVTKEGHEAIENEIGNELPGLVATVESNNVLPGLATQTSRQIDEAWSNLSTEEQEVFAQMSDVCRKNAEIARNQDQSTKQDIDYDAGGFFDSNLLSGATIAVNSHENQNQTNFQDKFGKGADLNQKQVFGRKID